MFHYTLNSLAYLHYSRKSSHLKYTTYYIECIIIPCTGPASPTFGLKSPIVNSARSPIFSAGGILAKMSPIRSRSPVASPTSKIVVSSKYAAENNEGFTDDDNEMMRNIEESNAFQAVQFPIKAATTPKTVLFFDPTAKKNNNDSSGSLSSNEPTPVASPKPLAPLVVTSPKPKVAEPLKSSEDIKGSMLSPKGKHNFDSSDDEVEKAHIPKEVKPTPVNNKISISKKEISEAQRELDNAKVVQVCL
jgi:hypothetical protein